MVYEAARDLGKRPAGLLRLAAPKVVVPLLLERYVSSFCRAYPEVEVEIAAGGAMGFVNEDVDVGTRV